MDPKLCVVGSNSFSGAWFVKHALDQGYRVLGVSRSDPPPSPFLPHTWDGETSSNFEFVRADLNHDLESLITRLREFRPGLVVNFAAQSMVGQSWEAPLDWYRTNVTASVAFIEELRQWDFLDRYVHISTPEVYGRCRGTITEAHPSDPSTPYAVSRTAFDMHLAALHRTLGFPVVSTRAANVFGPGQQLYRILPKALLTFLKGGVLPLHGGGTSVRSFIHMEDVCRATLDVAQRGKLGEIYHIATRRTVSIRKLVEMAAGAVGVPFEDHVAVTEDRPGKDPAYVLDTTKIRALGWEEEIELEAGMDQTLAWVREYGEILKTLPMEYIHKP